MGLKGLKHQHPPFLLSHLGPGPVDGAAHVQGAVPTAPLTCAHLKCTRWDFAASRDGHHLGAALGLEGIDLAPAATLR